MGELVQVEKEGARLSRDEMIAMVFLLLLAGHETTTHLISGSVFELAAAGLKAEASFENHHRHTYAYGTAAAHVAVDPGPGRVELVDYLVVEDVGRIVNPLTLHGQVIGATVQGLGGAFMENLAYDANGQLLAGTLADYLIPAATDFPNIRAIALEQRPSPTNPLGVKGAGEAGSVGALPAVTNALVDALSVLGIRHIDLPATPERLWRAIQDARNKNA